MDYYVSYAYQKKPGNNCLFASAVIKRADDLLTEESIIDMTNNIKSAYEYTSAVIISIIPISGDQHKGE